MVSALQVKHYLRTRRLTLQDHVRRIHFNREVLDGYVENFHQDIREWHGTADEGKFSREQLAEITGMSVHEINRILLEGYFR